MSETIGQISGETLDDLRERYINWAQPKRTPLSVRFPKLTPVILWVRQNIRIVQEFFSNKKFAYDKQTAFAYLSYTSSSLLRRRLGASDPSLQEGKVTNLKRAVGDISGVVINLGETFSLWKLLGPTTYKRGYTDGMVLSRGKVQVGVGGGLCQLANLLHWVFLHTPLTITERFHHSYDVFPDNGRTLPFGSGATIFYNLIDLQVKNDTNIPWQILVWLDEDSIKAEVRSESDTNFKYKVKEEQHTFASINDKIFRYNQIWRRTNNSSGETIKNEKICTNFAPVMYPLNLDNKEVVSIEV